MMKNIRRIMMEVNFTIFGVLIIFGVFIRNASALKCHLCTSSSEKACNASQTTMHCKEPADVCVIKDFTFTVKLTSTRKLEFNRFIKECIPAERADCDTLKMNRPGIEYCTMDWCTEDLCNESQRKMVFSQQRIDKSQYPWLNKNNGLNQKNLINSILIFTCLLSMACWLI